LSKRILSYSTADGARVIITSGNRGNTRFAVNQVSTAGDNYKRRRVDYLFVRQAHRSVSTNRLDEASLREAVRSAETLAKLSPEDPEALPELESQQYAESLGWSEATASLESREALRGNTRDQRCRSCGGARVLQGTRRRLPERRRLRTSRGLFAYGARPNSRSPPRCAHRTEPDPDGGYGRARLDAGQCQGAGYAAIEKAKRSVNPVAIEPGRYTVILEPTAVGNLLRS
jgi:predicted Zn-dependent protease